MLFGKTPEYFSERQATATAREINQQGDCWRKVPALIAGADGTLKAQLKTTLEDENAMVVFSGAGTSAYAGDIVAPAITPLAKAHSVSIASTDLVGQPAGKLPKGANGLLFSFGRSGNSPESVDSLNKAAAVAPEIVPVAVTCNSDGQLAQYCRDNDGFCCLMPPETHDESFVMTSSFSTMTLFTAALCRDVLGLEQPDFEALAAENKRISDTFYTSGTMDKLAKAERIIYLGSNAIFGAARESALKILEMTAGKIPTMSETSLGFRHGPKSLVDDKTVVCIFASNDSYTQQFDKDIALELIGNNQAARVIVFGTAAFFARFPEIAGENCTTIAFSPTLNGQPDDALAPLFVQYAQLTGLRCALDAGISPDNPSPDGSVNRVVQGVTLYPYSH